MNVVSVDVGYRNLAFIHALVVRSPEGLWAVQRILLRRWLDISRFTCDRLTCPLYHESTITDFLQHIVTEYTCFRLCTLLLVERQPPGGLIAIQEFFIHEFRPKYIPIHPRSIQSFFGLTDQFRHHTAEQRRLLRKEWSIAKASVFLRRVQDYSLDSLERKHDVADAVVQLWYFVIRENQRHFPTRSKYFLGA